ncbi:Uncharacterised protein [Mycobacteroides abscessus subsp. abscessus]|nr:Uncharacterised protein [Mycobacteroides abscessus subsp. abscessus]
MRPCVRRRSIRRFAVAGTSGSDCAAALSLSRSMNSQESPSGRPATVSGPRRAAMVATMPRSMPSIADGANGRMSGTSRAASATER